MCVIALLRMLPCASLPDCHHVWLGCICAGEEISTQTSGLLHYTQPPAKCVEALCVARCVLNTLRAVSVTVVQLWCCTFGVCFGLALLRGTAPMLGHCWVGFTDSPIESFRCGASRWSLTEQASYIKTLFGHSLLLVHTYMSAYLWACAWTSCRPPALPFGVVFFGGL